MKSKKSIFDAFVSLRSKKELRKITVKELCEKAVKTEKVEKTETAVKAESKTVKAEKPAEKKTTAKK